MLLFPDKRHLFLSKIDYSEKTPLSPLSPVLDYSEFRVPDPRVDLRNDLAGSTIRFGGFYEIGLAGPTDGFCMLWNPGWVKYLGECPKNNYAG